MSSLAVLYYGRDGRAISAADWWRLSAAPGAEQVALTVLGDLRVTTTWLGMDAGKGRLGAPLIFSTVIWPDCGYAVRTPTEAAALAAHDQAIAWATARGEEVR